jgi:superoxide dismutase
MAKIASMRLTASTASGAMTGKLPRALAAMSASTKNLRRACDQHAASIKGPGWRSAA